MTYSQIYDKLVAAGLPVIGSKNIVIYRTKELVNKNFKSLVTDGLESDKGPSTAYKATVMKQVVLRYNRSYMNKKKIRKNKITSILQSASS